MAFDKRKALQNALAFTQQGKWDRAIGEYQAILRAEPKDLTVCNNLGDLFARAGKLSDAIEQYLKLGELYRADGLAVKAIAVYKKIVKLDPGLVAAYLACADLYLEQGLVGEAKIQLGTAGELFAKAGNTAELVKIYQRLGQVDPSNGPLLIKLADLLVKLGRKDEAALEYERAAQAAQAAGQVAESKKLLKKAHELSPQLAGPSLGEAELLVREGKFAEAVAALGRITASEANNADAWRLLGEACVGAGQGAEGLAALRQAMALGVAEETLLRPLGTAMVLADEAGDAVALCERVTEDALNRGEPDDAVSFCRDLLVQDLPAIPVRTYFMTLLINLGRDEEARTEALALGAVHEAAADPESAARAYQLLLDRNPDDAEAAARLAAVGSDALPAASPDAFGRENDAAPRSAAASPVVEAAIPGGPEIILEDMDDLTALLAGPLESPAPAQMPEEPPEESPPVERAEAPTEFQVLGEPTIEFTMPDDEAEASPPLEVSRLDLETPLAALSASEEQAEVDLGEFSALLGEPGEAGLLLIEPEAPTEESSALAETAADQEPETLGGDGSVDVPVIELTPTDEPIVFPPELQEEAPEAEATPTFEVSPDGLLLAGPDTFPPASEEFLESEDLPPATAPEAVELPSAEPPEEPPALPEEFPEEPPALPEELPAAEAAPSPETEQLVAEQLAEAEVYLKYGLEEKARERLAEAIRLMPTLLTPRQKLASLALERGQTAEAASLIAGIVEILSAAGRREEAAQELRRGLAAAPEHPELRGWLATLPEAAVDESPPAPEEERAPEGAEGESPLEPFEAAADGPPLEIAETAAEAVPPVVDPEPSLDLSETAILPLEALPSAELPSLEELAETVAMPAPEEEPFLLREEPMGDQPFSLAETVTVPETAPIPEPPPAPGPDGPLEVEIPVELQDLLAGPEAGPMLLLDDERSERAQRLADDLAEAEFYLAQGMTDEARAVHRRLQSEYPAHPAVVDLAGRLSPASDAQRPVSPPAAPAPPPAPPVSLQDVIPKFTVTDSQTAAGSEMPGGDFVDLGAELAEELEAEDRTTEAERESALVRDVLHEFQKGIKEQIGDADYETHYNLGVAYKDMELFDEAIEEFRLASRGVTRALECAELLGQCFLAKGQPAEAVRQLRAGLEVPGHPRSAYHGLRYTLALAYDGQGEVERSLEQLEVVQGEEPSFRDVTSRVELLRTQLSRQASPPPPPPPPPPPGPASPTRKKRISFI